MCNNVTDCVPFNLTESIPQDLIDCNTSSGVCVCSECFELLNDTCQLRKCWEFNAEQNLCTDNRKTQKTAVLLSAFLSSVGAANFYIGQYLLGELPSLVPRLFD